MPKAKPISLHPLTFDEAIKALIRADPAKVELDANKSEPPRQRPPMSKNKKG